MFGRIYRIGRRKKFECRFSTYNNMASVYDSQGIYAKALEYYEKALAIWLEALGANHPDVASSYNNMATVYYNQGDYAKALVCMKRH